MGLRNYERILNKEDIWEYLQATAHFLCWTMILQIVIGFGLALLLNRRFGGHSFWTTVILLPMMLSPAVVGVFWTYLFQPQTGIFSYIVNVFADVGPPGHDRERRSRALGHRHGRYLDVGAVRDAHLPRRPAFHSRLRL